MHTGERMNDNSKSGLIEFAIGPFIIETYLVLLHYVQLKIAIGILLMAIVTAFVGYFGVRPVVNYVCKRMRA